MTDFNQQYPTKKVILAFLLLNTIINSFLHLMLSIIFSEDEATLLLMVLGSIFSLIPAFLTGVVLSYNKIVIHQTKDYFKVFLIGAVCLYVLTTPIILFVGLQGMVGTVALSVIFGIVSVIVAKFVLPKAQK